MPRVTDRKLPPGGLILGHRGSPREAVENTLESFAAALSAGADGVELDVRESRDGIPVVIHDDTLGRTMDVRGRVSALHWGAIARVTGARVPSLAQAVAWAAAAGAWLNIELKSKGVEEQVLQMVSTAGLRERTIISSFDQHIVRRVRDLDPELPCYFLTEHWNARARRSMTASGADGLCLHVDAATQDVVASIAEEGIPLVVWTVNEAEVMEMLLSAGVTIITDLPRLAAGIRGRPGR